MAASNYDEIIDGIQDAFGFLTDIMPKPWGNVVTGISATIDVYQEDSSSPIPTYKIVIADASKLITTTITGTALSAVTYAATIAALEISGPGAFLVFYDSSVMVYRVTNSIGDATHDKVLEYLTSSEFTEIENGYGDSLLEYRDKVRHAIDNIGSVIPYLPNIIIDNLTNYLLKLSTDISDSISADYHKFMDAVNSALHKMDPLVIDMSGNGIALDSFQASNALFDLNGDGTKENTGWTKANGDDAFLVIDKNSDGKINDISELFGNTDITGFAQLKQYDSNGDGVINSADSQFNLLKLWNDKNANGTVDAGELTTLAQNNITSISVRSYSNLATIEGNLRTASSDVTFTNGTTRTINELYFGFADAQAQPINNNADASLPASFQLNIASILLPYSRGYGSLHSWQVAMTLDATLLAMAQDIMATAAH